MRSIKIPTHSAPRKAAGRTAFLLGAVLVLGLGGCDAFSTDVENPNVVVQEDIEKPSAAAAIVNGVLVDLSLAVGEITHAVLLVDDAGFWTGTFDDERLLEEGFLFQHESRIPSQGYRNLAAARWLGDEAVRLLEQFEQEGTLPSRSLLAKAYLLSGITYVVAADNFEDFALSDRREAGPPVDRPTLFGRGIERLEAAQSIAAQTGDADLELAAIGWQARAHWSGELLAKMASKQRPAQPLVDNAAANSLAAQVLARAPADWKYEFRYSAESISNPFAHNLNADKDILIDPHLAEPDASGFTTCWPGNPDCPRDGIRLFDPVDQIQDPALRSLMWPLFSGGRYASLIGVSARELHLMRAEGALLRGDMAEFTTEINAVRALEEELTPYDPAVHTDVEPLDLLIHMREVNLLAMAQRRLQDMYRFGIQAPEWLPESEAATEPGTVLPIAIEELQSNCHFFQGGCG